MYYNLALIIINCLIFCYFSICFSEHYFIGILDKILYYSLQLLAFITNDNEYSYFES